MEGLAGQRRQQLQFPANPLPSRRLAALPLPCPCSVSYCPLALPPERPPAALVVYPTKTTSTVEPGRGPAPQSLRLLLANSKPFRRTDREEDSPASLAICLCIFSEQLVVLREPWPEPREQKAGVFPRLSVVDPK